jgi:hypothetical protein
VRVDAGTGGDAFVVTKLLAPIKLKGPGGDARRSIVLVSLRFELFRSFF